MSVLGPAARAFNTIAPVFDARFGEWQSVAAQRYVVRRTLLEAFPAGSTLLELGGGTGEDAAWLAARGFKICLTDAAPAMVERAHAKLSALGSRAEAVSAENLEAFATRHRSEGGMPFDGAFSNFAGLNCVEDLEPVARGLARLVRPGGAAILVLFGTCCPGEILVESLRGRPRQAFRRFKAGPAPARLGGERFTVTYHRASAIVRAMRPWFELTQKLGVGIFVPPSAAEPWISRHPALSASAPAMRAQHRQPCRQ